MHTTDLPYREALEASYGAAQSAPASRGERFVPIPTLSYRCTSRGQIWPLGREAVVLEEAWDIAPGCGRYQFNKHFYPVQADLKDGGEEFFCAQLVDNHAKVKHWVRNLTTAPCGFALATSRGRFFPDFVAELLDGRIAVIEYKGAHLLNDPYEIEKRQIGELWARKSQGKCLFGQITKERAGVGTSGQLDSLLA